LSQEAGHVGQPRSKKEGVDAVAIAGHRVHEMQEEARVATHGAGYIAEHHEGRVAAAVAPPLDRYHVAAAAQGPAQRSPKVSPPGADAWAEATGPGFHDRQPQLLDRSLGSFQLSCRHLLEVLLVQGFAIRPGEGCVDFDLILTALFLLPLCLLQGFRNAPIDLLTLLRFLLDLQFGKHKGAHTVEQLGVAPEEMKGLVENLFLVVTGDEDRMESPVKVVAPSEPDRLYGFKGCQNLARPYRKTRCAQCPREVEEVVR